MSTNKLRVLTGGFAMENGHGNEPMFAAASDPFAVFDPEPHSAGSFSTRSRTSSGDSVSQMNHATGEVAFAAPSRGFVVDNEQLPSMHSMSPQQLRRGSTAGPNIMSNSFTTPSRGRAQTTAEYSFTSPNHVTTPRSLNGSMASFGSPQVINQRRNSTMTQTPPSGRNGGVGSSRMSFSSNMRAPSLQQDPNAQSLTGISQILAVQEMAFRQGQHDAGVARERIPTSPFAMHFNHVWAEFYALGKECGGMPKRSSMSLTNGEDAGSHNNFPWPVLINPYTQDLEHPNGAIDSQWVRKICTMSLNCMEAIIRDICKRKGEWRRATCDVPAQIRQTLTSFDDLRARYEKLRRDAQEAIAGGLPPGYTS